MSSVAPGRAGHEQPTPSSGSAPSTMPSAVATPKQPVTPSLALPGLQTLGSPGDAGASPPTQVHVKIVDEYIEELAPSRIAIRLTPILLRYVISSGGKETAATALMAAFQKYHAQKYQLFIRITSLIVMVVSTILIALDVHRFQDDRYLLDAMLILRLVVVVPLCIGVIMWTFTRSYLDHTQLLVLPLGLLGAFIIVYAIVGKDPGYGSLAVYIVYLYGFTPLRSGWSTVLSCITVIVFGVTLFLVENVAIPESKRGETIGVLALFFLTHAFVGHMLELSLRRTFLEEYRLHQDGKNITALQKQSTQLLTSMMPIEIIKQLKMGKAIAEPYAEVTVLFCEIYHFSSFASKNPPDVVVRTLNTVYSRFDDLIDMFGVHKVETVFEVYMVVGGCPVRAEDHCAKVCDMALAMMAAWKEIQQDLQAELGIPESELQIRIGINSGPIVAGVVGIKNPRFKLFGDTVNTASRMESTCEPGHIQMSTRAWNSLNDVSPGVFATECRGSIPVKGKGEMITYWLRGLKDPNVPEPASASSGSVHGNAGQPQLSSGQISPGGPSSGVQRSLTSGTTSAANVAPDVAASHASLSSVAEGDQRHGKLSNRRQDLAVTTERQPSLMLNINTSVLSKLRAPGPAIGGSERTDEAILEANQKASTLAALAFVEDDSTIQGLSGPLDSRMEVEADINEHDFEEGDLSGLNAMYTTSKMVPVRALGSTRGSNANFMFGGGIEGDAVEISPTRPPLVIGNSFRRSGGMPAYNRRRVSAASPKGGSAAHRASPTPDAAGPSIAKLKQRYMSVDVSSKPKVPAAPVTLPARRTSGGLPPITLSQEAPARVTSTVIVVAPQHGVDEQKDPQPSRPSSFIVANRDSPMTEVMDTTDSSMGKARRSVTFSAVPGAIASPTSPPIGLGVGFHMGSDHMSHQLSRGNSPGESKASTSEVDVSGKQRKSQQHQPQRNGGSHSGSDASARVSPEPVPEEKGWVADPPTTQRSVSKSSGGGGSNAILAKLGSRVVGGSRDSNSVSDLEDHSDDDHGVGVEPVAPQLEAVATSSKPAPQPRKMRLSAVSNGAPLGVFSKDALGRPETSLSRSVKLARVGAKKSGSLRSSFLDSLMTLVMFYRPRQDCEYKTEVEAIERSFQEEMLPSWTMWCRRAVIAFLILTSLFTAQDYYKFESSDNGTIVGLASGCTISEGGTVNPHNLWIAMAVIRYAIMVPAILGFLAVTFTNKFKTSQRFAQAATAILVAVEGLSIIAISVVGHNPGYGILSMYIVFCLNLSVMNFAFRLIILSLLAICYLAAILIFNQRRCWGGITASTMLSHAAYFIIFMLGMSFSVFAREVSQRRQSERQRRATIQKHLLEQEERRSMALLANMLPLSIVKQLTEGRELIADQFDMVTVLFTDLKGFTEFASRLDPKDLVTFLNIMYTQFDLITDKYGLYKVEIIGDAYFVVGGCPEPCDDSAERCTAAALELIGVMPVLREIAGVDIRMRVGIHCGPSIAGVVGTKDPRYHLFGETGTYAMLMENTGIPDQVHMSDACRNRIFARQLERRNKFLQKNPVKTAPSKAMRMLSVRNPDGMLGRSPVVTASLPTPVASKDADSVKVVGSDELPFFQFESRGGIEVGDRGVQLTWLVTREDENHHDKLPLPGMRSSVIETEYA